MKTSYLWITAALAIGILLGLNIFYFDKFGAAIPKIYSKSEIELFGQIGDFFGGTLNPLFSLFSFLALLYTINIQANELALSRKELELTRAELAKSSEAQNQTQLAMNKQVEIALKSSQLDTINFLLSQYQKDLDSARSQMDGTKAKEIDNKIMGLRGTIEKAYEEVFNLEANI